MNDIIIIKLMESIIFLYNLNKYVFDAADVRTY